MLAYSLFMGIFPHQLFHAGDRYTYIAGIGLIVLSLIFLQSIFSIRWLYNSILILFTIYFSFLSIARREVLSQADLIAKANLRQRDSYAARATLAGYMLVDMRSAQFQESFDKDLFISFPQNQKESIVTIVQDQDFAASEKFTIQLGLALALALEEIQTGRGDKFQKRFLSLNAPFRLSPFFIVNELHLLVSQRDCPSAELLITEYRSHPDTQYFIMLNQKRGSSSFQQDGGVKGRDWYLSNGNYITKKQLHEEYYRYLELEKRFFYYCNPNKMATELQNIFKLQELLFPEHLQEIEKQRKWAKRRAILN
jgi:hypothetical protein